jgi:7,8-dihydroneopterin aldolase/epimerase/oxygenase
LSTIKDRMDLLGIEVQAKHGVLQAEKETNQLFKVDVSLWGNFEQAQRDDDLSAALDYSCLHGVIQDSVIASSFDLIEALAGHLCRIVLAQYPVEEVSVTVTKVHPPITGFKGTAGVTLRRGRSWYENAAGAHKS